MSSARQCICGTNHAAVQLRQRDGQHVPARPIRPRWPVRRTCQAQAGLSTGQYTAASWTCTTDVLALLCGAQASLAGGGLN